jgi:hypothetical protein
MSECARCLLSNGNSKPQRKSPTEPLTLLQPRPRITGTFVPWGPVPPQNGEVVRWQCIDGRWIAVELGQGDHAGLAKVSESLGRCEYVDSFEAALELATKWRTV